MSSAPGTEVRSGIFAPALRTTTFGLLVLMTLIAFEATAVAPALPTAARELHGLGAYGWAFTGFLVAEVLGMVVSGQVADLRGPRLPLIAGMSGFLAGLLVSGTATTMTVFIAGRVVQGLASGLLITAMYVLIGERYHDRDRPMVFSAISSAWVVPSLVGPVVAGAVTQHIGWRGAFLGLTPFAVIGSLLLLPVLGQLREQGARRAGGLADPRRILHGLVVAAAIAALTAASDHPSVVLLGLGVVAIGGLAWGLRTLLPPGTFSAAAGVGAPILLRGLLAGAFFGAEVTVPLSLTVQHGYAPTAAGLPLAFCGVTWAAGSWWQSRGAAAAGLRRAVWLMRTGFVILAVGTALVAVTAVPAVPGWLMYLAWALGGLGAGLAMPTIGVLVLRFTSDATRGTDSSALQLADATCSALTSALGGALIAAAEHGSIGFTAAFVTIGAVMGAIALVGMGLSARPRPVAT